MTDNMLGRRACMQTISKKFPNTTILVVDDYPLNHATLKFLLTPAGCTIVTAENGLEAVYQYTKNPKIDLIFMDVGMPLMDGLEATRQIRLLEKDNGRHIPIIALTANAEPEDRMKCLDSGMDDYVSKPIKAQLIEAMLDKYISPEALSETAKLKPPPITPPITSLAQSGSVSEIKNSANIAGTKYLNNEISLLKAFGIIAVVISHHLNPSPEYFTANSYEVPLFFFASGYLYSIKYEDRPLQYIKKRFVWFLSVFYIYHLYHALELYLLNDNGIIHGTPPEFPQFFYYPFVTFSSYWFGFPMWFVLQLFIVQILYLFIRKLLRLFETNDWVYALIFFPLALLSTVLAESDFKDSTPKIIIFRTIFLLGFLHLGQLFRTRLESKALFTSTILVLVFIIQTTCIVLYNSIAFTVGSMNFFGHPVLPFVVSCTGIYVCFYLAKALSKTISEQHILCRIGNNSFHICAMHMSFCFIVVLILRHFANANEAITDPLYSFDVARYWVLYVMVGVLCPVFLIEFLRKIRDLVFRRKKVIITG